MDYAPYQFYKKILIPTFNDFSMISTPYKAVVGVHVSYYRFWNGTLVIRSQNDPTTDRQYLPSMSSLEY